MTKTPNTKGLTHWNYELGVNGLLDAEIVHIDIEIILGNV